MSLDPSPSTASDFTVPPTPSASSSTGESAPVTLAEPRHGGTGASTPPAVGPRRLRDLPKGERPQERALAHGVGALSDLELLALILRSGTRGRDVLSLAAALLAEAGALHTLVQWTPADFRRVKGIGRVKALQLCTVMEVARRVLDADRAVAPHLETSAQIYAYLRPRALGLPNEKTWVLTLNSRNRLLRCVELSSGTARQTLVRPAEVLRETVRENATAFVLAHNHPSGDPQPSAADVRVTRQLRDAAAALDLVFLDHLVLGEPASDPLGLGYYSFRGAGLL